MLLNSVLVGVLVISALAQAKQGLGSRFRTVIGLYLFTTFCAAMLAVGASFLFPIKLDLVGASEMAAPGSLSEIFGTLLTNTVENPLKAIANANYVAVLFWAIIFGFALKLKGSEGTIKVVSDCAEVVSQAVRWVIECAFLLLRKNPYPLLLTCLKESGISAFFTRSSAANIPINLSLCKKLGLDPEFYSVSIPLGATINMEGAAITITVLSLAVAHTAGVEVSFVSALVLSVVATLGACGTSGVAGGSLLLVPMACSFFGIPGDIAMQAVAVGFIIGVVQDSVETALNSRSEKIQK